MQAALITAYRDLAQLQRLVRFFSPGMRVFVHIDRKSSISIEDVTTCGGFAMKKYMVGWGAIEHLWAVQDLMRLALRDPHVSYLHILSGQDMPLHPLSWFLEQYDRCEAIHAHPNLSTNPGMNEKWYEHYWPSSCWHLDKRNGRVILLDRLAGALQSFLGIRCRGIGDLTENLAKSLVYVSLPVQAAQYALDYYDTHDSYRRALRHCYVAEELFFMPILMNSPFADRISGQDLHYCDWSERNGAYPAILDASDYGRIYDADGNTPYAFARKVDSRVSAGLIDLIETRHG